MKNSELHARWVMIKGDVKAGVMMMDNSIGDV